MRDIDQFRSAHKAGTLVFFVGAGASFRSHAPMPAAFKESTSRLFFPQDPDLARMCALVLDGVSVPSSDFLGIQPEVFYEHLLTLCPDVEALGLWRALSPAWLAKHGQALRPNANHFALVRYAQRTGLPVFTTNFDTLIETAANRYGGPEPCILLPGSAEEEEVAQRYALGVLDPGRLNLFKVHGSIDVDGVERLDSLKTTMTAITARNSHALGALANVLQGRRLVLLGYSGSNIDFFPSLLAMAPRASFWFDPEKGGNKITTRHLQRLHAVALPCDPASELAKIEGIPDVRLPSIDFKPLFETLRREMRVSLSPAQKLLLLGMCLHSVGYNEEAWTLFADRLSSEESALAIQDRILARLTRSRIADATSRYDRAEVAAHEALDMVASAGPALTARAALKARALYHLEQARQQTIGPMIRLGDVRTDWRPSIPVLVASLARGLWVALRLEWLVRPLRAAWPDSAGNAMHVRAVHAANDHLVMMFGRVVSVLGARARRAPLLRPLRHIAEWLRELADRSGDFFGYAGAEKYVDRLSGRTERDAVRTYLLLRDPLNFALARRDEAMEALEAARDRSADRSRAAALFEEARVAAHACGSRATEAKAFAGLAACGIDPDRQLGEIAKVTDRIEGRGYAHYRAFILQSTTSRVSPSASMRGARHGSGPQEGHAIMIGSPWLGTPGALHAQGLRAAAELVFAGRAVDGTVEQIARRLGAVEALAIQRDEDDVRIIGIAAVKNPATHYRERVFGKASVDISGYETARELGYISIADDMRGKHVPSRLIDALLADAEEPIYSTTDNASMRKTLARAGFAAAGSEWEGRRGMLSLWLRPLGTR